ncbi:hypothetical protein JCM16814_07870 [Desulfobaculum senezii]|jgi:lysylphosphatidylglycerol synthetase-like protein (DUF2156 family)
MVIYAGAVLVVLLLAWHFYVHAFLTETLFSRMRTPRFVSRMLSLVCFVIALFILWTIAGVSVLSYLAAVLGTTTP